MCEEWWMWRRLAEADESRGLWDEFERTHRMREPEPAVDEPEVELGEREPAPAAER